jgi:RES domain-containing protein
MIAWRITSDTLQFSADSLSGAGAALRGGRWNERGLPMAYASQSRALACLETLVHLDDGGLPLNRYLVQIDIPDAVWAAAWVATATSLPVGWDAEPMSATSVDFGTAWARSGATTILRVPSVIVPEEENILINPAHPDAARITASKVRRWLYDPRLR